MPDPATPRFDALIFTALGLETTAVVGQLTETAQIQLGNCWSTTGIFNGLKVGVIEVGAGNSTAAAAAAMALSTFAPPIAAFVGVAGGVKDVRLGDVVVATKVYGYESGKEKANTFAPRGSGQSVDWELEQRARVIRQAPTWQDRINLEGWGEKKPSIFVEPIAAGEKVVASNRGATAKFIKAQYSDTVAVEMEGRGFLDGVRVSGTSRGIIVRGISDLLSGKAQADAESWQPRAAAAAAAVLFEILSLVTPKVEPEPADFGGDTAVADYRLLNGRTELLRTIEAAVRDGAPRSYSNFITSLEEARAALAKADKATLEAALAAEAIKLKRPRSRSDNSPDPLIVKSANLGLALWSSGDEYLGHMSNRHNWGVGVYKIYTLSEKSTPDYIAFYRGEVYVKRSLGPVGVYEFATGALFAGTWSANHPRRGYMSFVGRDEPFDFYFGEFREYTTKSGNIWKPGGIGVGISLKTQTITCGAFEQGVGDSSALTIPYM